MFQHSARVVVTSGLVLAGLALPGCLISSHSNEDFSGKYVSRQTFGEVVPGETTETWILGTLGEPTSKTTLEDGSQLWKYAYTKTKSSRGSLLFVFGGSSRSSTGGSAYVQIKNGIVVKHWRTDD